MKRVNRSEKRPFIFTFRLNIVPLDSYQIHETVMEIKKWKQKFQATMSNALAVFY